MPCGLAFKENISQLQTFNIAAVLAEIARAQ